MRALLSLAFLAVFVSADGNFTNICSSWSGVQASTSASNTPTTEILTATCPNASGGSAPVQIDLARCVANHDGHIIFTAVDTPQYLSNLNCVNVTISSGSAANKDTATISAVCSPITGAPVATTLDLNTIVSVNSAPALSCSTPIHPTNVTPPAGWTHSGCYGSSDAGLRNETILPNNTPANCMDLCHKGGFEVAGTRAGEQCWCDHALQNTNASPSNVASCPIACRGDGTQLCGGEFFIDVFQFSAAAATTTSKTSSSSPTSTSPSTSTSSAHSKSSKSSTDTGAIAGGIVGALAILGLGTFFILWILRRRGRSNRRASIDLMGGGRSYNETINSYGDPVPRMYNPNDPSTYPSVPYVASFPPPSTHQTTSSSGGYGYRGAAEV